MTAVTYLDACPACAPGDPPASPPAAVPERVPGGIVTAHGCVVCGAAWQTFWRDGWPVDRLLAPVAAGDAARNRETLARAARDARASGWPASRTETAA